MSGWGPREVRYTVYPPPTVTVRPSRRGLTFSGEELRHILIGSGILTAALTLMFLDVTRNGLGRLPLLPVIVVAAAITTLTGFLLHELAHKAVAQRYGAWSEFRTFSQGLFLTLLSGLFGFVIGGVGAVYSMGTLDREQSGRVSVAGPLTNFACSALAFGAFLLVRGAPLPGIASLVPFLVYIVAYANAILGAFNMIPFGVLDGAKILAWNRVAWGALLAGLVALVVGAFIV